MQGTINLGQIIRQTLSIMADDFAAVLMILAGLTAVGTFADQTSPALGNLLGIPVLVLQFYTIRRLVDRHGLRSVETRAGFGSFFILGIITGIPILLGYLLLIVPGLYLTGRWVMVDAALCAENEGSGAAMRRSWALTADHGWTVALAFVLLALPTVIALSMTFAYAFTTGDSLAGSPIAILTSVALNLLAYSGQVAAWYLGVAVYQLFVGEPGSKLEQVFA